MCKNPRRFLSGLSSTALTEQFGGLPGTTPCAADRRSCPSPPPASGIPPPGAERGPSG